MLEDVLVWHLGGWVLWWRTSGVIKNGPIDALIDDILLGNKPTHAPGEFVYGGGVSRGEPVYTVTFRRCNRLELIFAAVHVRSLALPYVTALVGAFEDAFTQMYEADVKARLKTGILAGDYDGFDRVYDKLLARYEVSGVGPTVSAVPLSKRERAVAAAAESRRAAEFSKGHEERADGKADANAGNAGNAGNAVDRAETFASARTGGGAAGTSSDAFDLSKLKAAKGLGGKKGSKARLKGMGERSGSHGELGGGGAESEKKTKGKTMRAWGPNGQASTKVDVGELDLSRRDEDGQAVSVGPREDSTGRWKEEFLSKGTTSAMDMEEDVSYEDSSDDDEDAATSRPLHGGGSGRSAGDPPTVRPKSARQQGWFNSMIRGVVGKASLDVADLEPAIAELEAKLRAKNVAGGVAKAVCEGVQESLAGMQLASFTGVKRLVRDTVEKTVTGLLTPRSGTTTDVLAAAEMVNRHERRPYTIVFCGVNGVGKTTSLAKVMYWLRSHGKKVTLVACDTFRAGAVEQLKIHARNLGAHLFERGYERDAAVVAREGIKEATVNGSDLVLIDTAGRMQDNEPLMRALSKLILTTTPDLVIFVGEALVGNDGVDQLMKFNRSLADLSAVGGRVRAIDGVLLTKFDTVDSKVGAALSMVHTAGQPILFIGCGETYTDLKRLNVKAVVKSLLN